MVWDMLLPRSGEKDHRITEMLVARDSWRSPSPISHQSRTTTNIIPLSQPLSSQVIKSFQGRRHHHLSGAPGGGGFPNGQREPPHPPCVAIALCYVLWHHQGEFGSVVFVVPKKDAVLQLWMHQCWEREGETDGASSFSHSLILWARAWCRHCRASSHVLTAGCQRGLNG